MFSTGSRCCLPEMCVFANTNPAMLASVLPQLTHSFVMLWWLSLIFLVPFFTINENSSSSANELILSLLAVGVLSFHEINSENMCLL